MIGLPTNGEEHGYCSEHEYHYRQYCPFCQLDNKLRIEGNVGGEGGWQWDINNTNLSIEFNDDLQENVRDNPTHFEYEDMEVKFNIPLGGESFWHDVFDIGDTRTFTISDVINAAHHLDDRALNKLIENLYINGDE